MVQKLGSSHVETLICMEDLAMSRIRLGEHHLPECQYEMLTFVYNKRK